MSKIKKALQIGVLSIMAVLVIAAPSFASIAGCLGEGEYVNLSDDSDDSHPVRCTTVKDTDGEYITIYGASTADCAKAGSLTSNPENCKGNDLNTTVRMIITAITMVIGTVSVIMIILGGISYATSQGDAAKVKKGKDTILYGIIGLVIALLAYAIVAFVLGAIAG